MTKSFTDKIIDLIARESERAYRRGFQQGKVIGPQVDEAAIHLWRYRASLAKAPTPETGKPITGFETARDRLECECPSIVGEVARIARMIY